MRWVTGMRFSRDYADFFDIRLADAGGIRQMRRDAQEQMSGLLTRLGLAGNSADYLIERWWWKMTEPQRHYHSPVHVMGIFDTADRLGVTLDDVEQLAIWFHDVVNDPVAGPGENENRSAAWLTRLLAEAQVGGPVAERAAELIRWTAHHVDPQVPAGAAMILDLDLSGLGSADASFRRQCDAVRAECGHLSDETYARGIVGFFRRLLDRAHVYRTASFAALEPIARRHLESEIRRFSRQLTNC